MGDQRQTLQSVRLNPHRLASRFIANSLSAHLSVVGQLPTRNGTISPNVLGHLRLRNWPDAPFFFVQAKKISDENTNVKCL